jgi:urea transport system ATP-binding protein
MFALDNVHAGYGQSEILHGISLSAETGTTLAIMGRNGMGKTTLMKSMIGIIACSRGTITLDDQPVQDRPSYQRVRRGIGFVPQGRQIFPSLSVEENIRTGLSARPGVRRIPEHIYETFPVLYEMRCRKGGNLSGGQQQQLAIARALASAPRVLLLDEPTEGIQPSIIKELAVTLNQIKQQHGLTILVSEQMLSFAMAVADHVVVLEGGHLVHHAARDEVDEADVARYLSV